MPDRSPDPAATIDLPLPPRPLTRRVRLRAWADPHVRVWWVMAAVTLGLGLYLGASAARRWQHERWLTSLPPVTATIVRTDAETVVNRPVPPGTTMELTFTLAGVPQGVRAVQRGYKGEPMIGQSLAAYVNPDDPSDLTIRNEPQALTTALTGAIIMAVLAVLPLSAALETRARVLRAWRLGEARPAAALARQQTALAPGARAVRCAWADDGADRRVFAVYVPGRSPEAGDASETVRVLAPPGGRGRPVAVAWFE
jgi:hypothetical protein